MSAIYDAVSNNFYRVMRLGSLESYTYYTNRDRFDDIKGSYIIDYRNGVMSSVTGTASVYGAHMLNKNTPTLIVTQGERDCIALKCIDQDLEVVGSPNIDKFDWISNSSKLLNQYSELLLLGDNKWKLEVYRRLSQTHNITTIDNSVLNGRSNVYDSYMEDCIGDIVKSLKSPSKLKIEGIKTVADLRYTDWKKVERIYTGINDIDSRSLGLPMGLTSLWSGGTGQGKTTVVNKIILNAMQQDYRCCVYSGEIDNDLTYSLINLQACKHEDVDNEPIKLWDGSNSGEWYSSANVNGQHRFREWSKDKLFIKHNDYKNGNEADNIITIFESAYRMHNCRLFVVDNLMSILADNISDDTNKMQTYLMSRLVEFAVRCNVHVMVVAHFRKVKSGEKAGNDDVAGSSNVPNMAGAVYAISRFTEQEQEKINKKCEETGNEPWTGVIVCSKNRTTGKLYTIKTRWDVNTRQIYGFGDKSVTYNMYNDKYAMKDIEEWN